jgi:hypothetical protein
MTLTQEELTAMPKPVWLAMEIGYAVMTDGSLCEIVDYLDEDEQPCDADEATFVYGGPIRRPDGGRTYWVFPLEKLQLVWVQ